VIHRSQQERPELAALRVGHLQRLFFQQPRKECLRQILSIVGPNAVTPNVGIEWIPVSSAELRQCLAGVVSAQVASGDNKTPVRRGEMALAVVVIRYRLSWAHGHILPRRRLVIACCLGKRLLNTLSSFEPPNVS